MVDFLLAKRWDRKQSPIGWWVSEKLDGHRSYWDGEHFRSRDSDDNFGKIIKAPHWFTKGFPNVPLDGELYAGRGNIGLVTSAVNGNRERDWEALSFPVFDVPNYQNIFEERIKYAHNIVYPSKHINVIKFWICNSKSELLHQLDSVVNDGGEGLMLRKPRSFYERKRSNTSLKVKKRFDAEAVVIGYEEGTRPGLCGALKVMNKAGLIFKVASGMTEVMAKKPPSIGTIITYEWELLTKEGIPRPAIFKRIRQG